jgi:hypothetical protein
MPIKDSIPKYGRLETVSNFIDKAMSFTVSVSSTLKSRHVASLIAGLRPYRAIIAAGMGFFAILTIDESVRDGIKAKGKYKLIPSFRILDAIGSISDGVSTILSGIVVNSVQIASRLAMASNIFGGAAIALQVFGVVCNCWEIHSIRKQGAKFKQLKNKAPSDALQGLTSQDKSRKFFRVMNSGQCETLTKLNQVEGEKLKPVVKLVDRRIKMMKGAQAMKIVLGILTIVGLALLMFAPTPLTPIIWGGMAVGVVGAVATGIFSLVSGKLFTRKLNKLAELAALPA